ncbi:MAG TPA: SDR family oxidoreductase [Pseudidiomarina sp.]|nr:SDR family oxidoreductase [Pseudidiomarina sp.]
MTRSIFISGAAAGIGRATALYFAAQGWRVGAFDIDEQALASLAVGFSENIVTGYLDVRSTESWQNALEQFCSDGSLEILFNNAGILVVGDFTSAPASHHTRLIDVNCTGVTLGCYTAFPYLQRASRAKVITMCSASALFGQPQLASYSASKFFVKGMTEALSLEWEPYGIQVMDAAPLFVRTAMVDGPETPAMRKLGIRLEATDIALAIWRMAHYRGNKMHWHIGAQTKLAALAAKLSPHGLNRWVNRRLTT